MARLKDIAEEAGVSIPTVSLILSGKTQEFNPDTCRRVLQVADKLEYRPNIAARSLQQQKSFLIALLVSDVNATLMSDLLRGVFRALGDTDYSPVVFSHAGPKEERNCLERCLERRVDGLIVNVAVEEDGSTDVSRYLEAVADEIPIVEIFGHFLPGVPSVNVDFKAAGRDATRHLIELGHRSIVHLTHEHYDTARGDGSGQHFDAWERYLGCEEALQHAGMAPRVVAHPISGEINVAQQFVRGGAGCLESLLGGPQTPTAVVCYNDFEAYGLLQACRAHGIKVPEQLSIVGYADGDVASISAPPLTTLRIPAGEVGSASTQTLMELIDGKTAGSRLLSSELVVRRTTGPVSR